VRTGGKGHGGISMLLIERGPGVKWGKEIGMEIWRVDGCLEGWSGKVLFSIYFLLD
jgi:hypothetical protein